MHPWSQHAFLNPWEDSCDMYGFDCAGLIRTVRGAGVILRAKIQGNIEGIAMSRISKSICYKAHCFQRSFLATSRR